MTVKGDKSPEELQSGDYKYAKGGMALCFSPPLRRKRGCRGEAPGQTDTMEKHTNRSEDLQREISRDKHQQEEYDIQDEKNTEAVGLSISPDVDPCTGQRTVMGTHINRTVGNCLEKPDIVRKLRSMRQRTDPDARNQPLKADHNAGKSPESNHRVEDNYTPMIHTADDQANDPKMTTSDTRVQTNDSRETESYPDPNEYSLTSDCANKEFGMEEEFATTTEKSADEKEQKVSKYIVALVKLCAENRDMIRKRRHRIAEAKRISLRDLEEEEKWQCRFEMYSNRVAANSGKIKVLYMNRRFPYTEQDGKKVTMNDLKSDLFKSRQELVYQLSRVEKTIKETIKEKTMERRRMGETYPRWLLPNFRKAYLKYSESHGLSGDTFDVKTPTCPPLDLSVSIQKRLDSSRQHFKILIDGRLFNYRKTGLTQVMSSFNEEANVQSAIQNKASMITDSQMTFRKPRNTSVVDVPNIIENGCDDVIFSIVDERLTSISKMPISVPVSADDKIKVSKEENGSLINERPLSRNRSPNILKPIANETSKKRKNIAYELPPIRNTPSPKLTVDQINRNSTKKIPFHSANDIQLESGRSDKNSRQSDSEGSIFSPRREKVPRQKLPNHKHELKNLDKEQFLNHGDGENKDTALDTKRNNKIFEKPNLQKKPWKLDKERHSVQKQDVNVLSRNLPTLNDIEISTEPATNKSWQSKHQILPPIRKSKEPAVTKKKCSYTKVKDPPVTLSIECDSKFVPVKIPHREMLYNKVTYVMAIVRKEKIPPFSIKRHGSSIPVRYKYLKENIVKKSSARKIRSKPIAFEICFSPPVPKVTRRDLYVIPEKLNQCNGDDIKTEKQQESADSTDRSTSALGLNSFEVNDETTPADKTGDILETQMLNSKDSSYTSLTESEKQVPQLCRNVSVYSFGLTPNGHMFEESPDNSVPHFSSAYESETSSYDKNPNTREIKICKSQKSSNTSLTADEKGTPALCRETSFHSLGFTTNGHFCEASQGRSARGSCSVDGNETSAAEKYRNTLETKIKSQNSLHSSSPANEKDASGLGREISVHSFGFTLDGHFSEANPELGIKNDETVHENSLPINKGKAIELKSGNEYLECYVTRDGERLDADESPTSRKNCDLYFCGFWRSSGVDLTKTEPKQDTHFQTSNTDKQIMNLKRVSPSPQKNSLLPIELWSPLESGRGNGKVNDATATAMQLGDEGTISSDKEVNIIVAAKEVKIQMQPDQPLNVHQIATVNNNYDSDIEAADSVTIREYPDSVPLSCDTSSSFASESLSAYGLHFDDSQEFIPHPPLAKKPTLCSRFRRFFSKRPDKSSK